MHAKFEYCLFSSMSYAKSCGPGSAYNPLFSPRQPTNQPISKQRTNEATKLLYDAAQVAFEKDLYGTPFQEPTQHHGQRADTSKTEFVGRQHIDDVRCLGLATGYFDKEWSVTSPRGGLLQSPTRKVSRNVTKCIWPTRSFPRTRNSKYVSCCLTNVPRAPWQLKLWVFACGDSTLCHMWLLTILLITKEKGVLNTGSSGCTVLIVCTICSSLSTAPLTSFQQLPLESALACQITSSQTVALVSEFCFISSAFHSLEKWSSLSFLLVFIVCVFWSGPIQKRKRFIEL